MAFAPILAAVSTAVGALGAVYQGNAAAAQANAQADNAAMNARNARLQGNAQEETMRRRNALQMGNVRAAAVETGFDPNSGSLASLQVNNAQEMELDALTSRYSSNLDAISFDNEAATRRSQASAARKSGYLNAFGTLALGAASYGGLSKIGGELVPASPYW